MKHFPQKVLLALPAALLLAGCAGQRDASTAPPPESRTKTVLEAQYAAEGRQPPMQAEEADRIYDAYLQSIGKNSQEKTDSSE